MDITGRKITIQEFARFLGVSPSTVSKALNGTGRMSDETRRRICRAAEDMNYRPSLVAANLRGQKTRTIGVMVPHIGSDVFSAVVCEVEKFAGERDYNVILCTTGSHLEEEYKYAQMLMQRRVEGIIAVPYGSRVNHDCSHFLEVQRMGVPVVLVEQNIPGNGLPLVVMDNHKGARDLTEYLIREGHRRIIFVGNTLQEWDYAGLERHAGYREALADNGIRYDGDLVFRCTENYIEAMVEMLQSDDPPTALFGVCDTLAMEAISQLHRRGIEVPRDFSVAGFDNIDMAAYYIPALTTVEQATWQLGRRSAEILFDIIDGKIDCKMNKIYERIPCRLVVRESCSSI